MARVPDPYQMDPVSPPNITVFPLSENKRPIGFTAWTDEKPRKRKKKSKKK